MTKEEFEQKLYCWIRQKRIQCAIHRCLYYEFDSPVLTDEQYDFLEKSLIAVEKKHPDIAKAIAKDGYWSPNDYVGYVRFPGVYETTRWVRSLNLKTLPKYTVMVNGLTDEQMYEMVIPQIEKYPV